MRTRALATKLFDALGRLPRVHLMSPRSAAMRGAMALSFTMAGTTAEKLQGYLGAARIRTRRIAEFGYEYLRLSTHIYVLPSDIDRTVELLPESRSLRRSDGSAGVAKATRTARRAFEIEAGHSDVWDTGLCRF